MILRSRHLHDTSKREVSEIKRLLGILVSLLILSVLTLPVAAETLRVAGDENFPPYEFVDSDGIFKGFNVDLMKAIGLFTDLEFEFLPMPWEEAYASIEAGQADIIQGMKVSEARKLRFAFSTTSVQNTDSIYICSDTKGIKTFSDLAGKRVGVDYGDVRNAFLDTLENVSAISYQNPEKALLSLHRGDVDAMIGNTLVISYFSTRNNIFDEVTVVGKAFNKQNYAIAVAVDSTELLARLNKGIEAVQESGIYDQIYRKWFGVPVSSPTQNIGFVVAVAAGSILVIMSISYIYHRINWRLKAIIAEETAKEKAAMDKLREYDKLQFMDRIISSIAHEIRNPLTSIRFYAEQIPEKISDRKFMMAVAEDIPPEIERIDALIKEFIEYTVPRTPFQEAIFLKAALEQVLTFLHVQMRDIQVDMTVPPDLFILFDRNHLRQILLNILINSIDALEGVGDPRIIIHAAADGGMVVIEFFDNGGGADEERLPYLFDPFYTTKQSGNGLGLFIVRQMAEENGGCVSACNQAGGMMIRLSVLRQTPATP